MSVVTATTPEGHRAAFVVADPPAAEDLAWWAALAAEPGLRDATWAGAAGESSR